MLAGDYNCSEVRGITLVVAARKLQIIDLQKNIE